MAEEGSRTTLLVSGGRGLPKIHSTRLGKRVVATIIINESEAYELDVRWGGLEEGVTHVQGKVGQLLDDGQRNTLATSHFGGDRAKFR